MANNKIQTQIVFNFQTIFAVNLIIEQQIEVEMSIISTIII